MFVTQGEPEQFQGLLISLNVNQVIRSLSEIIQQPLSDTINPVAPKVNYSQSAVWCWENQISTEVTGQ
jgi:hypothetical protein